MSVMDALAEAGAKPAGKRPWFLDEEVETILAITMAVAQELAVTRQRADTLERLLEEKNILSREEIETFRPSPEVSTERALANQEYIARILRIVQQRNEAATLQNEISSEDVGSDLAGKP